MSNSTSRITKLAWCRFLSRTGEGERLRRAAGLSIADVAAEVGVHPNTLRRWETGLCSPHTSAALRWFDVMREVTATTHDTPVETS